MRIAVVGSHGVGKTTLVEALSERLNLPVIPEASRVVMHRQGMPALTDLSRLGADFQWKCLGIQQTNEERNPQGFVSDRGWPDYLAYPLALGTFGDRETQWHYTRLVTDLLMDAYDLVIYLPIEFDLPDDGVRSTSIGYQMTIDALVWPLAQVGHHRFIEVEGSVEDRVAQVLPFVSLMGRNRT